MMYPKQKTKKRRMLHPPSILPQRPGECYLCERLGEPRSWAYLEKHHIFDGPNKKISEENGFTVKLCVDHHREGPRAVHRNIDMMRLLQRDAQRKYEQSHSRKQFMELIGRNYLEDVPQNCKDCGLGQCEIFKGRYRCFAEGGKITGTYRDIVEENKKPEWCPLKKPEGAV